MCLRREIPARYMARGSCTMHATHPACMHYAHACAALPPPCRTPLNHAYSALRAVAECMIWGDQNAPEVFEFFLEENNFLEYIHCALLAQPANRSGAMATQVRGGGRRRPSYAPPRFMPPLLVTHVMCASQSQSRRCMSPPCFPTFPTSAHRFSKPCPSSFKMSAARVLFLLSSPVTTLTASWRCHLISGTCHSLVDVSCYGHAV